MPRLRFFYGPVEVFREHGVSEVMQRFSNDSAQMLVHQEDLTDDQMEGLRFDERIKQASDENLQELLQSSDWIAAEN